ncbi:SDR family oxidoreductase [Dyadobacter subterraneus]|uniref:SDR family NAD(P)-dependent oxidoreductase n=1 Tax=Dyadobacter subterraneus TaxID=2773304 RepID=A0ABR9WE77_9BACT|nr:SDR family NAD(P)-dependent oxidoreductase [Dyadobacter subterraneus]MBE9463799.1 SDR family NAD(P)-dependent oxidoreductase [Dyadobacter subterraneus]
MKLRNSTVLITGGTSGIGLEFARQLLDQGANVIVTGRDLNKLTQTKKQYPQINIIQSDINNPKAIEALANQVTGQFPELNIIINNAGIMNCVELLDERVNLDNITSEIDTNFIGTIRMIHQFLPHLMTKTSSAVINVTSGLAYIPFITSPIYCATKAGIHIYSQALRHQLKKTAVKVFEVAPPKTDKPMQTAVAESGDRNVMKIDKVVSIAIQGILNDRFEINPGIANLMKWMSRIAPGFFTNLINTNIEKARMKNP